MFPKVFNIERGILPRVIFFSKKHIEIEQEFSPLARDEDLLGLQALNFIFIYPQSSLEKVLTIFHEYLHWLNFKTLDKEWIDSLIDFGGRRNED